MLVLNFYTPVFIDQLKRGRKTATVRLGDKSHKYRKGEVVVITVGYEHSPRERIFDAVIEHDNPEFRRLDEEIHFLEQIYGRTIGHDDTVTVVRFSQIVTRPTEISSRMTPQAPHQN